MTVTPVITDWTLTPTGSSLKRDGTQNQMTVSGSNFLANFAVKLSDSSGDTFVVTGTSNGDPTFPSKNLKVTFTCTAGGSTPIPNCGCGTPGGFFERFASRVRESERKVGEQGGDVEVAAHRPGHGGVFTNVVITVTIVNDPNGSPCAAFCSKSVPV